MVKRKPEYRVFSGTQYPYVYTVATKRDAQLSKKALQREGKKVRITKGWNGKGYTIWASKAM